MFIFWKIYCGDYLTLKKKGWIIIHNYFHTNHNHPSIRAVMLIIFWKYSDLFSANILLSPIRRKSSENKDLFRNVTYFAEFSISHYLRRTNILPPFRTMLDIPRWIMNISKNSDGTFQNSMFFFNFAPTYRTAHFAWRWIV